MNKIEKLHLDSLQSNKDARKQLCVNDFGTSRLEEKAAKQSTEITKDIAIKYKEFWLKQDVQWFFGYGIDTIYKKRNGKEITEEQLFNIFIETL